LLTIALAFMLGVLGLVAVLAYVHKANDRAIAGLKAVTVLEASSPINAGTNVYTAFEAK
jgi:hypothetical protein